MQFVVQLTAVFLFAYVIIVSLVGVPFFTGALVMILVWVVWWSLVVALSVVCGKVWCYVCPWVALGNWLERLRLFRKAEATLSIGLRWPRALANLYPASLVFLLIAWLELEYQIQVVPQFTAYLAITMTIATIGVCLVFERRAFCRIGFDTETGRATIEVPFVVASKKPNLFYLGGAFFVFAGLVGGVAAYRRRWGFVGPALFVMVAIPVELFFHAFASLEADTLEVKARRLMHAGRRSEAMQLAREELQKDPGSTWALLIEARGLARFGNHELAVRRLETLLAKDFSSIEARWEMAQNLAELGKDKLAALYCLEALDAGNSSWCALEKTPGLFDPFEIERITPGTLNACEARLSGNGDRLYFTSGADGSEDVFVLTRSTGKIGQLTTHPGSDILCDVSQDDHELILFASDREGVRQLYATDEAGSQRGLTAGQPGVRSASFSPDGSQLVLAQETEGAAPELYLLELWSMVRERLTWNTHAEHSPSFTPDGKGILYSAPVGDEHHLFVMDLASGEVEQLTDSESRNRRGYFFPDGERMVYTSDRNGNCEVYLKELATGGETRLTRNAAMDLASGVSADGKSVVVVSHRSARPGVYLLHLDRKVEGITREMLLERIEQ